MRWATAGTKRSQGNNRAVLWSSEIYLVCGGRPCSDKGKATVMSNVYGESGVTPTESKIIRTVGNLPRGNREIPETSVSSEADRSEQAYRRNADVYVSGKSDSFVVPSKRANKTGPPTVAESVEGRRLPKENVGQSPPLRTQSRLDGSCGLPGVRSVKPGITGPSISKGGAVCGSSARTDLCGGPPVRAVPTAISGRFRQTGYRVRSQEGQI